MASRLIAFIAFQGILVQIAYSQCINRPNVVETIVPNQFPYREPCLSILPSPCGGPILPPFYQNPIIYNEPVLPILPAPCASPIISPVYENPIISEVVSEVGYPRIIQDDSVANSLANALQLLVVSNLLSTTLPGPREMPAYPYEIMPAYNYIY